MLGTKISKKHAFALIIAAFLVRASVMYFFIQPHEYYKQADSIDYHNCALGMALGSGMYRLGSDEPIFWRTPGYPPYLALFYNMCGVKSVEFSKNAQAQSMALWVQIILASFIPLILFYLAYTITHLYFFSYTLAWISVFHPGIVLASTYLLTEGLALIFFYLFLLFFYRLVIPQKKIYNPYLQIIGAILCLSMYTWMRPMGEFVGYFSAIILLCAAHGFFTQRFKQAGLFALLFFMSLLPWYYRNYQLTDEWFFCPTVGTYLNVFNAPKILRRTTGKPLIECHKILGQQAAMEVYKKREQLKGTGKHVSNNVCKNVSVPVCMSQPFYFMYDWIAEVIKTTFDLYSYQLVAMARDAYWYDPIEEYLPEKISDCLWNAQLPLGSRMVCWAEFIFSLLVWIGLFGGLWICVARPLVGKKNPYTKKMLRVWLISVALIGISIGMSGGFGYARLRLPIEPLMIILSLTFWYWLYRKEQA